MTLGLLANGVGLVSGLLDASKSGLDARDRATMKKVSAALSDLFFFEDRTRQLILALADGQTVPSEALDRALEGLNRSRDPVAEALDYLDKLAAARPWFISLDSLDKLRSLKRHKADVRWLIEQNLRAIGEMAEGEYPNEDRTRDAKIILAMIDDINGRLSSIDNSLRS